MRARLALALAALSVAGSSAARAQIPPKVGPTGLIYDAQPGDSYETLAQRFYGRRFFARHLRMFNRNQTLKGSAQILIPTLRQVEVRQPQSVRTLAEQHLQDPGRAPYLKLLNRLADDDVPAGTKLLVGQSLRHTVRATETFESIAKRYYRRVDERRVQLLRLYNKRPTGPPTSSAVRVPLDTPVFDAARVQRRAVRPAAEPAPPPPVARPRKKPARKPRPAKSDLKARRARDFRAAATAVQAATAHLSEGRYRAGLEAATAALSDHPSADEAQRVELMRIQAVARVALGQPAEAEAAFEELLEIDPQYTLDPHRTSPKILEAFDRATAARRVEP